MFDCIKTSINLRTKPGMVYVIKRPFSQAMYTIGNTIGVDGPELPRVICFQTKGQAQSFNKYLHDEYKFKSSNAPCIDQVPLESLKRRCSLNRLAVAVFNKDGSFETLQEEPPIDDFMFHLENSMRWFCS